MNTSPDSLDPVSSEFYREALNVITDARVPFLLGGAFAFQQYTGLTRDTKDVDIFVRPNDIHRALDAFAQRDFEAELTFPHWLGKAARGDYFIDIIFSSGNGIAVVDDEWFEHAGECELLGIPVRLSPVEEMIWSKAFVMERERFDGADVAHLLRACGESLDWERLLRRFDGNWRVLFSHLTLFGYIYPSNRDIIPDWVMFRMVRKLLAEIETEPADEMVCRGTVLSRAQYTADIREWGYADARVIPTGAMTAEQAEEWTDAGLVEQEVALPSDDMHPGC